MSVGVSYGGHYQLFEKLVYTELLEALVFEVAGCGRGGGPRKSRRQEIFEGLEYTRRSLVAGPPSANCVRGVHQEFGQPQRSLKKHNWPAAVLWKRYHTVDATVCPNIKDTQFFHRTMYSVLTETSQESALSLLH